MDGLSFALPAVAQAPAATLAPVGATAQRHAPPAQWGAVATAAGAFAASRGRAKPSMRRHGAVARAAVPMEKPTRTTLFTKAAPDGVSLGDCPFSHAVQIALPLDCGWEAMLRCWCQEAERRGLRCGALRSKQQTCVVDAGSRGADALRSLVQLVGGWGCGCLLVGLVVGSVMFSGWLGGWMED
eukprot:Skav230207  [mRNA]  locus=scaffold2443:430101:432491:+ [translate_table: standard]